MSDTTNSDSGQTTSTTGQTTSQTTGQQSDQQGGDTSEAVAAEMRIQLAKFNNDAMRLAESLINRNYHLRQRAQDAEARVPKEGQVVISQNDSVLLKSYKALGTPTELQERQQTLSQLQQYQMVSEAAAIAGMNPKVLNTLLPTNAVLEIGDATGDDGTATRVVTLKHGEEEIGLEEYAQKNWSDFLPALKADATSSTQQSSGAAWLPQTAASGSRDSGNKVHPILKEHLERARERAQPQKTN